MIRIAKKKQLNIKQFWNHPIVSRWTNCLCFAMDDPFATFAHSASDRKTFEKIFENADENDSRLIICMRMWEGGSPSPQYHFLINDGEHVIEKKGLGGPIIRIRKSFALKHYYNKFKHVEIRYINKFDWDKIFDSERRSAQYIRMYNALYEAYEKQRYNQIIKGIKKIQKHLPLNVVLDHEAIRAKQLRAFRRTKKKQKN